MNETVTTILEIDASPAEQGASAYTAAMARAAQASNDNLNSIAASTAAVNAQLDGMGKAANAANDNNGHLTIGLKQLAQGALEAAESLAKKAAVATVVVGVMGTLLGVILPIYTAYKILKTAIDLVSEAWELGAQKLAEYVALGDKAVASGLSTDFYQRIIKAATDAKLSNDGLIASFKTLNDVTADKLGGSTGQQKITSLTGAGNFKGNTGVSELAGADTTEQKFKAIVDLVNQAIQGGQRLAALDVANTFLGPTVAANLAKDSEYLNKMLASANTVKGDTLISQESVDNAAALQAKMDAATAILEQRWHPIQDLLVQLGIAMHTGWVNIVSDIAAAVDQVAKLVEALGRVPSWFQNKLNSAGSWIVENTTTPESRKAAEEYYGISTDPKDIGMLTATNALRSQLGNPANIAAAGTQTLAASFQVRKDTSVDPNAKPPPPPDTGSFDRATGSLQKYIEVTNAAAASVDAGVYEQERLKAIAELTAAGLKDGLAPAAAKAKAEMSDLGDKAGAAALQLAKAKVASEINFGANTAFLSQGDVAIATQLKGLYPDVATALNSAEASQLRFNAAAKQLSSGIENNLVSGLTDIADGSVKAGQGFANMGLAIVKTIEQMIIKLLIVGPLMKSLQESIGSPIGSLFGISGVGSYGQASNATGLGAGTGGIPFPMFAGGTSSAPGGWSIVGENGPELMKLPAGAQVLPNGQMPSNDNGGGTTVNVSVENHNNSDVSVSHQRNSSGGTDVKIMVRDLVNQNIASGQHDSALGVRYGMTRRGVVR